MFPQALSVELLTIFYADPLDSWVYSSLAAPYWRYYANTSTGASVFWEGRTWALNPGWGYIIPPDTDFSGSSSGSIRHFFMHFLTGEPFASLSRGIYPFRLTVEETQTRDTLAEAFRQSGLQTPSLPPYSAMAEAAKLIWGALSRFSAALPPPKSQDPRVAMIRRVIDESRGSTPSNDDLARLAAMHPDSMIRLFRKETGTTPARWSQLRRLERACVLLAHSGMGIKEIADLCGFPDRNYFTALFTKTRGKPPAEWRRSLRH